MSTHRVDIPNWQRTFPDVCAVCGTHTHDRVELSFTPEGGAESLIGLLLGCDWLIGRPPATRLPLPLCPAHRWGRPIYAERVGTAVTLAGVSAEFARAFDALCGRSPQDFAFLDESAQEP